MKTKWRLGTYECKTHIFVWWACIGYEEDIISCDGYNYLIAK